MKVRKLVPCKVLDGDSESTSEQTKPLRYHDCTLLETDSIPKQELTIIETQEINAFEGVKKRELLYSGG